VTCPSFTKKVFRGSRGIPNSPALTNNEDMLKDIKKAIEISNRSNISNSQRPNEPISKSMSLEELQTKGNNAFQEKMYDIAISYYTEGLKLSKNANLFNNRAVCLCVLGEFEKAIQDADSALNVDQNYSKAYYTKALSYEALGKYEEAEKSLIACLQDQNFPGDKDKIRQKLLVVQEKLEKLKEVTVGTQQPEDIDTTETALQLAEMARKTLPED
jgi:tetratricopeptide (TPR) repeat protein